MTKRKTPETPPENALAIPDFLQRNKDGSLKHPKAKVKRKPKEVSAPAAPEQETSAVETITDPEFKAHVEAEIRAGRLNKKWLNGSDATITLGLLQSEFGGKRAKKEERLAVLKELNEEKRKLNPPKPKATFPEDSLFVTAFATTNPRKPGSANHAKYEGFLKFMAANPTATVLEVVSKSGYYRNDLMWDVKQGRITLGQNAPAKKQTPAAKKEAKGLPPIKKKPKPGEPGSPGPKLLTKMLNAPFKKKGKKK